MADPTVKVRIKAKDEASASVDKVESRFKRLGTSIKANALKITAALAAVVVAFRQIEESAGEVGRERALERNLAAQGIAVDAFVAKLKDLSDNQIATADLILASNRALALGISAADLPGLMTVAANAAVELGITTTQAFNDITTGVGRASPLILDNLGIVVDAVATYKAFAESIGVSAEALTKQQKTMALTQAVIKGATGAIEDFETKQDSLTRSINRSKAAMDNFKSSLGAFGAGILQIAAGSMAAMVNGLSLVYEGLVKVGRAAVYVASLLPGVSGFFEGTSKALKGLDDDVDNFQDRIEDMSNSLLKGGLASFKWGLGMRDAVGEAGKAAPQMQAVAKAVEEVKEAEDDALDSTDALTESIKTQATAMKDYTTATAAAAEAQRGLGDQAQKTSAILTSQQSGPGLFPGLSGSSATFERVLTAADIAGQTQYRSGQGVFYKGRKVRVLPDGTVEFL